MWGAIEVGSSGGGDFVCGQLENWDSGIIGNPLDVFLAPSRGCSIISGFFYCDHASPNPNILTSRSSQTILQNAEIHVLTLSCAVLGSQFNRSTQKLSQYSSVSTTETMDAVSTGLLVCAKSIAKGITKGNDSLPEAQRDMLATECAQLFRDVVKSITKVLEEMDEDTKDKFGIVLGADSIRFNELMIFLAKLGGDMAAWGHKKTPSEDPATKDLEKRMLRGIIFLKYFIKKLDVAKSSWTLCYNVGIIFLGLVVIAGSVVTMVFLGGGDGYLVAADTVIAAAGGTVGFSLLVNGIRLVKAGIVSGKAVEDMRTEINDIQDTCQAMHDHIVIGFKSLKVDEYETVRQCGLFIAQQTLNAPAVPEHYYIGEWVYYSFARRPSLYDIDTSIVDRVQ
jgi:hypothetical protein